MSRRDAINWMSDSLSGAGAAGPGTLVGLPPLDVTLAVLGAIAVAAESLSRDATSASPFAYLLVIVAAAPLVVRTVWPLGCLVSVAVGAVLCAAVLHASWAASVIVAFALFTVALLGDRRRSLAVGVATATLVIVAVLAIDGTIDGGAMVSRLAMVVICVAAGELIRTRQELIATRRERVEQEQRERAEALRHAAEAERLAIARELHDSLGHFLVAINVRASVAIEVPDTQDPTDALTDIKQVSASALRDLRSTLSVLREQDDLAPTAPAPGLEALGSLVDRASRAGVDTTLELSVNGTAVPAAASAATVRIVQESLTNVLRHAQAKRACVRVHARGGMLDVEITDDGSATPVRGSGGFGLRGMSERATALGGQLEAGPQVAGGWSVHARLPLVEASRA